MALNKLGDLMTALRKYTNAQGEEKTQWGKCGALFQRENGDYVVKLDLVPLESNGWLAVFRDQPKNEQQGFRGREQRPAQAEPPRARKPDPRAQEAAGSDFEDDIPF